MNLWLGLVTTAAFTAFALRARAVDRRGAVVGAILALILVTAESPAPYVAFVLFVVIGSAASRIGTETKRRLGVLQAEEGRRSVVHALSNAGAGASLVAASRACPYLLEPSTAAYLAVASFAAVLSDTMASEIGTLAKSPPRHCLTWRRLPVGTDGAVSPIGLCAGVVFALVGSLPHLVFAAQITSSRAGDLGVLAASAFAGNLVDSLLGATVQRRLGRHGNSLVNLACSLAAPLVALSVLRA